MQESSFDYILDDALCGLPLFSRKKEFQMASYNNWAVDELRAYVKNRIKDPKNASKEDYIFAVECFKILMNRYSLKNPKTANIFLVARDVAWEVLTYLYSIDD